MRTIRQFGEGGRNVRDSTYTCSKQRASPYSGVIIHSSERATPIGALHVPSSPSSNYQSEGRRHLAALSGLSSTRDGRETVATFVRLQRHDGSFNKAPYFSPHETSSFLLNLSSPRSQIHKKYSLSNIETQKTSNKPKTPFKGNASKGNKI